MPARVATRSRGTVLAVMCAGYFLVLLDVTIVNVALPDIRSGLGASVAGLQWVVDGYAIALASTMLAAGTIGDVRGHRNVVLGGFAVFGAASLACALAPSTAVLVAARTAQGIGAALLLPGTLAVISDVFAEGREQARAIGLWAGLGSAALPAGPLLGGALVQLFGWRAVFLVNVPIVLVAAIAALRVTPATAGRAGRRIDARGTVLAGAALALATFALIEAGREGLGVGVIVVGAVALACIVLFVAAERRAPEPMLPLGLFRRPRFAAANGTALLMNLVTLGLLFLMSLYLQEVGSRSALAAGIVLLPLFTPLVLLAPVAGRLTARTGPRPAIVGGLLAATAGVLLLTQTGVHGSGVALGPALLLWGAGLGFLTPGVVAAAMAAVPRDRAGLASAVSNTARQAGGAIGIAAFGAIAGSPARSVVFVTGLHRAALFGAALWIGAAAAGFAVFGPRQYS